MPKTIAAICAAVLVAAPVFAQTAFAQTAPKSPLDFSVKRIDGTPVPLSRYKGKVLLLVNTASNCGYTKQYEGLEALNKRYKARGLRVLGFPANDFGGQEPGTDAEIAQFCTGKYSVSFDMFSKISVAPGTGQAPLYAFLTEKRTNPQFAGKVGWNFTKFLVDGNGKVIARFEPGTEPMSPEVIAAVEAALPKPVRGSSRLR